MKFEDTEESSGKNAFLNLSKFIKDQCIWKKKNSATFVSLAKWIKRGHSWILGYTDSEFNASVAHCGMGLSAKKRAITEQ